MLINDELRRKLGLKSPAEAIGKPLNHVRPLGDKPGIVTGTIVGVVPDFPDSSIREPIEATIYYVQPEFFHLISIKLSGESVPEALEGIRRVWREVGDPRPIDLFFFDQHTQALLRRFHAPRHARRHCGWCRRVHRVPRAGGSGVVPRRAPSQGDGHSQSERGG